MFVPKTRKYRKAFKGRIKGNATCGASISFGQYALKALTPERLNSRQIEAARRSITRYIKRSGKLWIRVFPDYPVSKKPADVRMGGGKGSVETWVFRVKPGKIIFELDGVNEELARGAFERAAAKLPFKCKFMKRLD